MTQRDLNRAVARATGESVSQIERLGFSELAPDGSPGPVALNQRGPLMLDWDELDRLIAAEDLDGDPPLMLVA